LTGTHQFLVNANDVNIFDENMKKNIEALLEASKEVGLEADIDKTKYMFLFYQQSAGQNHNIKMPSKSSKNLAEFKYLGMAVTDRNCIHKDIKSK
jgi:hypothetical protein